MPVLWVHGHTHNSFDYQVGNCRVVCNPRVYVAWTGKAENRAFDAGFALVVEEFTRQTFGYQNGTDCARL